jgi:hypothetical protein
MRSMSIQKVFTFDIAEGGKDVLLYPSIRLIEFPQQVFYLSPAGRTARGTTILYLGEITKLSVGTDRILLEQGQGPDDGELATKEDLMRDHGAYLPTEKGVEQEGLYDVIFIMPQGYFITPKLMGGLEEDLSSQPCAEKTGVFPVEGALDQWSDPGLLENMIPSKIPHVPLQGFKIDAFVSEINRQHLQLIIDGNTSPALVQDIQHHHTVFPPREGYQYPVTIFDQTIAVYRLSNLAPYFALDVGHPSSKGHPAQWGFVLQKVLANRTKRA